MANILESAEISGVRLRVLGDLLGAPTAAHSVLFMTADGLHFTDENGHVWRLAATDVTPPSGGDLIWSDDFHRADSDTLGDGWVYGLSNMIGISGNRAVSRAGWNSGPAVAITDGNGAINVDDYAVEGVFPHSIISANPYWGITFRGTVSGVVQGYSAIINSGMLTLIYGPGWNSYQQVNVAAILGVNQDHTIRAEIAGNACVVLVDGTEVINRVDMENHHDTGHAVGFVGDAGGTGNIIALSLSVYSLVQ